MESHLLSDIYTDLVVSGRDTRFQPEAYGFILASLDFHRSKMEQEGHLEAEELVDSVIELSLLKFGPMAEAVLRQWGIKESIDVGSIVYNLIDLDILSKTDEDTHEQFKTKESFFLMLKSANRANLDKNKIKMLKDS